MKQKRLIVTVSGVSSFPIDMLRYDRCTPMHETDSGRIQQSMWRGIAGEKEEINLLYVDREPTEARWKSFGWEIVKTEKVI
jgi:hypothetical protein